MKSGVNVIWNMLSFKYFRLFKSTRVSLCDILTPFDPQWTETASSWMTLILPYKVIAVLMIKGSMSFAAKILQNHDNSENSSEMLSAVA